MTQRLEAWEAGGHQEAEEAGHGQDGHGQHGQDGHGQDGQDGHGQDGHGHGQDGHGHGQEGHGQHGQDGQEDWVLVTDPSQDRQFMDSVRRKILQCVSTASGDEEEVEVLDDESLEEDDREGRWNNVVKNCHDEHTKDSADDHEDMKSNVDCEEFPRRGDIAQFIRSCSLYEEESHSANLMDIVKCYVKSARKAKIMKILDEYFSEEEDNAEDAIFLISEVLYGGE